MKSSDDDPELIFAKATYYLTRTKLYIPYVPIKKGYENVRVIKRSERQESDESSLEVSIRRTKNTVRDYVWCNRFELFATYTFKQDRSDIKKCKDKMAAWLKRAKKLYPDLKYLIVPEFHKDQSSIHFHALLKGYQGEVRRSLTVSGKPKHDRRGRPLYFMPSYQSGFSDVQYISQDIISHQKVGNYVRKYITKDMPVFYNKNRYWASKGLIKPRQEDNPSQLFADHEPDWTFQTPHGEVRIYNRTPELRELESTDE